MPHCYRIEQIFKFYNEVLRIQMSIFKIEFQFKKYLIIKFNHDIRMHQF